MENVQIVEALGVFDHLSIEIPFLLMYNVFIRGFSPAIV
jgi:hypothetical protein